MSSKTFFTISQEECCKIYKDILKNSTEKWKAGKKLADAGDYGAAISLRIISIEEAIKAFLIFFDGYGFEFRRIKGMRIFFKDHQIRYILAYWLFAIGSFGEDLKSFITNMNNNPDQLNCLMNEIKKEDFFDKKLKMYLLRKIVSLKREMIWFSNVDNFRQNGFYSGYEEEIRNPGSITKEEYLITSKKLNLARVVCIEVINGISSQNETTKRFMNQMRLDFKQKDFYQRIAFQLEELRKRRISPFDLMKENLNRTEFA